MNIRNSLLCLAGAGLVLGSTAASAAPVAVEDVRVASSVGESEQMAGMGFAWIVALIIALGVIGIVVSNDDQVPVSA